jgi:hypothetical protein
MDSETKWTLKTGTVVEDRIYDAVMKDPLGAEANSLALRWVISKDDDWVNGKFTVEEEEEIYRSRIFPEVSGETKEVLASLEALKGVSFATILPFSL